MEKNRLKKEACFTLLQVPLQVSALLGPSYGYCWIALFHIYEIKFSVDGQFEAMMKSCKFLKIQIDESLSKIASLAWKLNQLLKSGKFDAGG